MSWRDEEEYPNDAVFTRNQMAEVTAQEVLDWFNFRAFGTSTPCDTDRPTLVRTSTLLYWKKALSSYMPNRNMPWNELRNEGNPTRAHIINDMIRRVRRFETRAQGAAPQARRALQQAEFRATVNQCRQSNNPIVKYGIVALLVFQFHMIGRVDDCCKWLRTSLAAHEQHTDTALKARLAWSKNVTEERHAPWQYLLGSMDSAFCVLLNLALWLEVFHGYEPDGCHRPFVFGFSAELDNEERYAGAIKRKVYNILRVILTALGMAGLIGSHSIRKFASTWVRSNGITKDDKDHRGRWKHKRVSDGYDDIQLDAVDAKVASVLCIGGVCNYHVVDPACSCDWITTHVTPNINKVFGTPVAYVLGKALLWLAFSTEHTLMPVDMKERIDAEYMRVRTLNMGSNPVEKRLMSVTGEQAQVHIEEVPMMDDDENPQGPPPTPPTNGAAAVVTPPHNHGAQNNVSGHSNRQLLLSVMGGVSSLRRAITEQSNAIETMRGTINRQQRTLNSLVRKIDMNPLHRLQQQTQRARANNNNYNNGQNQVDEHIDTRARLHPRPTTMHQVWQEYVSGIGTNKPARFFTRAERGRDKHNYAKRKHAWMFIQERVDRGMSATQVIDAIYQSFGPDKSVTALINCIRQCKRTGEYPPLLQ